MSWCLAVMGDLASGRSQGHLPGLLVERPGLAVLLQARLGVFQLVACRQENGQQGLEEVPGVPSGMPSFSPVNLGGACLGRTWLLEAAQVFSQR